MFHCWPEEGAFAFLLMGSTVHKLYLPRPKQRASLLLLNFRPELSLRKCLPPPVRARLKL